MKTTQRWSKMLLAGMAAMVLAFGLVVVGCDDGSKDDDPPSPYGNGSVTFGGKSYRAKLTFTGKNDGYGNWTLTVPDTEDGTLSGSGTWTATSATTVSYTGSASGTGVYSDTTVTVIFNAFPIQGGSYGSVVGSFSI
ncbi:hypothetical protein AGMMS50255_5740 [Spirochaetia bacterium]|nr:hypothetical protein AGMMS50255_5740 [Spirochaetia bacterium]